jgi:G:T-mismatch repair DNA endonuclease (very short patch repair protein)
MAKALTPKLPDRPLLSGSFAGVRASTPRQEGEAPPKPEEFFGTLPEWQVYWWLTVREKLVEGEDFSYQSSLLGGREQLGGMVADFILLNREPRLVINVQGGYWHRATAALKAHDVIYKAALQEMGYDVVYVLEADLAERLATTMRSALQGIQLYQD